MKSKKFFFISALLLLSVTLMACSIPVIKVVKGSGTLATETREVGNFDAIQLDGSGKLVITQGETNALQIEAEDNILPDLKSTVEGSTLVLGFQDKFWQKTLLPTVTITYSLVVTDLTAITFNGAGDLDMNLLDTDSLTITVNGAGQVKIANLTADSLSIQINGTGMSASAVRQPPRISISPVQAPSRTATSKPQKPPSQPMDWASQPCGSQIPSK